jgi:predicted acetyltransferase
VLWEDGDGRAQGYVTYRIHENWDDGLPGHTLSVEELVALNAEVRARLWQFCFDVDLVRVVSAGNVPVDEPLWWMLDDPRRLRVKGVHDLLWVRMLDVETALSARTYASDAVVVIEVVDRSCPEVAGRYRLVGGGGGAAECRRTADPPDLVLEAADLASAYLGAVRFATLARAGLVSEVVPGALSRADSLFATTPGPACCTRF